MSSEPRPREWYSPESRGFSTGSGFRALRQSDLRAIIDVLPPQQIHALLTLLEAQALDADAFNRRLAEAPEEEIDAETAAELQAAGTEAGEYVSHAELKRQLGL